jgi:uncharacterized protein
MNGGMVKVSVYINEGDEWHHRPLHLEVLKMLDEKGLAGGTVLHAVAGFTAKGGVQNTSLVDAGGKLPLVIEFVDTDENVQQVLPLLKEMVRHRLIVTQKVATY